MIWHAHRAKRPDPWLLKLLARKPAKLVAVALANKMARIVWKLMVRARYVEVDASAPSWPRSNALFRG